jgi:hypothetical protein
MGGAILIAVFILWLALTMWVYFDATERGKPSFAWAGAVFFLNFFFVAPLILYLIFRDTGQRPLLPPGGGRRQYLYIVSFAGLGTLMLGLTLLSTTTVIRVISEEAISDNSYRQALAGSLAAIIVGAGFWATHWFRASLRLNSITDDQDFRATFYLHRSYLYTVFGLSWIIIFVAGLWLLGGGLADAFGTKDVAVRDWLPAIGPLAVAFVAIVFHYMANFETPQYKQFLERFETIAAPLMIGGSPAAAVVSGPAVAAATSQPSPVAAPPRVSETRYCTHCASMANGDDLFCAACGTPVRETES